MPMRPLGLVSGVVWLVVGCRLAVAMLLARDGSISSALPTFASKQSQASRLFRRARHLTLFPTYHSLPPCVFLFQIPFQQLLFFARNEKLRIHTTYIAKFSRSTLECTY